jgi:hypothetical protein
MRRSELEFLVIHCLLCRLFAEAVGASDYADRMFNAFEMFVMQSHTIVIHSYLNKKKEKCLLSCTTAGVQSGNLHAYICHRTLSLSLFLSFLISFFSSPSFNPMLYCIASFLIVAEIHYIFRKGCMQSKQKLSVGSRTANTCVAAALFVRTKGLSDERNRQESRLGHSVIRIKNASLLVRCDI